MPVQTAAAALREAAAILAAVAVSGAAAGRQNQPRPARGLPSPPRALVVASEASQEALVVESRVAEAATAVGSKAHRPP